MREHGNYVLFSIGEYELARFADYVEGGYGSKFYSPTGASSPGTRKAHTRNIGGKVVAVKQGIMKAGARTAGALKAGASGAAAGYGKTYAAKGADLATAGVKKVGTVIANNPRAALIGAGITAGATGAGYLAGRQKKRRRS